LKSLTRKAWEWCRSVLIAFALFLIIRAFLVEAFTIPTASMENTLLVGDFLVVNKAVYGAEVPGTALHLPAFAEIERRDVIVFTPPHDPGKNYVKRVIGVPGDVLQMRAKKLYLNEVQLDEPYMQARAEIAREFAVEVIGEALKGVEGTTALHMCFGYAAIHAWQGLGKPDAYSFLPELNESAIDQISIEAAQPKIDLDILRRLPDKTIILGVIDNGDHDAETPEVVADRICLYAEVMGDPRRVIAGTDCGFSTFASYQFVADDVAWAKLQMLADGAALHGLSFAAGRAQPGFGAFAPAPPAPLPRHPSSAFGLSATVGFSGSLAPGVAGAFGLASSFEADLAETSPGRGFFPAAFWTNAHLLAFGRPPPVAFALVSSSRLRVTVGHPVSLPGVDGIRTAGAWPARRLAAGLTGTASCPTRGARPRAEVRCPGFGAPCRQ